ncbi:flavin reductase family protein [Burkholderia sp. Bp9140]|uniref:flavin reductase family protein n=1 Tax=Burkholderia sp. Bp9140 TaxID=2184572 RepID=UPI000F584CA1|nr:flavin reductase family protein [Burkholderia sp. Bp9140]RQR51353.1 flavin reductase family protein [Burkholderia sp. Bp9140]
MFYEPDKNNHGLPFNPFKATVVPRAIGWITTLDRTGRVNLAPFSQFVNIGYDPPYVMFSAGGDVRGHGRKDSAVNAVEQREFVCNMATWELRDAVNVTSQAVEPGVDEAALAGLEMEPSRLVRPPRVARSPIQLECVLHACLTLPGNTSRNTMDAVIGRVVGVHIADSVLTADGKVDLKSIRPICRLGYMDYAVIENTFEMRIDGPHMERNNDGLLGNAGGKIS